MTIQFVDIDKKPHTIKIKGQETLAKTLKAVYAKLAKYKVSSSEIEDISTQILDQVMKRDVEKTYTDIIDNPAKLHTVVGKMLDAVPESCIPYVSSVLGVFMVENMEAILRGLSPEARKQLVGQLYASIGHDNLVKAL